MQIFGRHKTVCNKRSPYVHLTTKMTHPRNRNRNQEKKRKISKQSVSGSDNSHNSDSSTLTVSSILGEANGVLYGTTDSATQVMEVTKGANKQPVTSTPLPATTKQNQQDQQNAPLGEGCPPWAKELFNAFRTLETKVNGMYTKLEILENMDAKVVKISTSMSNFETELSNMKTSITANLRQTNEMITTLSERTDGLEFH